MVERSASGSVAGARGAYIINLRQEKVSHQRSDLTYPVTRRTTALHCSLTSVVGVAVAVREARGARRADRSAVGSVAGARGASGVAGAAIGRIADCVGLAPVERIQVAVCPPIVAVSVCAEEFLWVALG